MSNPFAQVDTAVENHMRAGGQPPQRINAPTALYIELVRLGRPDRNLDEGFIALEYTHAWGTCPVVAHRQQGITIE